MLQSAKPQAILIQGIRKSFSFFMYIRVLKIKIIVLGSNACSEDEAQVVESAVVFLFFLTPCSTEQ